MLVPRGGRVGLAVAGVGLRVAGLRLRVGAVGVARVVRRGGRAAAGRRRWGRSRAAGRRAGRTVVAGRAVALLLLLRRRRIRARRRGRGVLAQRDGVVRSVVGLVRTRHAGLPSSAFTTIVGPGRRLSSWPCTATPASCCGCRSWARPTGSSRSSPAATARSARWRRGCGAPVRGGERGWSRSTTSTCSATRAARSTSSPRPRPSTRSARGWSATTAATRPGVRCWRPPTGSSPRKASQRCGCTCWWSARSGRCRAASGTRRSCSTRSSCAR